MVFQAEVFAIHQYASVIKTDDATRSPITICSDNQAALKALESYTLHYLIHIRMGLCDSAKGKRSTLSVCARCSCIRDCWGTKGQMSWEDMGLRSHPYAAPMPPIPLRGINSHIDKLISVEIQKAWNVATGWKTAETFYPQISRTTSAKLLTIQIADLCCVCLCWPHYRAHIN